MVSSWPHGRGHHICSLHYQLSQGLKTIINLAKKEDVENSNLNYATIYLNYMRDKSLEN